MVPDAELSIVSERIAKETSIVGGTREGYRLTLRLGIDNGVYTTTKLARCWVEVNAAEIIVNRVKLMTSLMERLCRTEEE